MSHRAGSEVDSPARRVVRQSGIYSIGNVAVKAAGLLLAPILLNPTYLSLSEYGYLALLLVTAQLCILTFGIGISTGLLRFHSDPAYEGSRSQLPFTALVASAVLAIAFASVVYLLWGDWLGRFLLDSESSRSLIGWILVYATLKVIGSVSFMHLRVTDRPGQYAVLIVGEMLVLFGAAYLFMVERGLGLRGAVLAYVVAGAFSATSSALMMLPRISLRLDPSVVRPLVRFGAPLVVASLSAWLLNVGDRYMLKWLSETATVGLYDFGSRVGGIVNLVFVQSFQLAFAVIGLRQFDEGRFDMHRAALRHYAVWTGWFVLALSILADDAMLILVQSLGVDRFYLGIDQVVLPVAAGFWFYGMYHVAVNVLYGLNRTRMIARYVLGAAIFNLVLNLILIPRFGALGAALATTISFAALAFWTLRVSERLSSIDFDIRIIAAVAISVIVLWAASAQLDSASVVIRLSVRLLLIGMYFPLILLTRAFRMEDFARGLRFLRPGGRMDGT
ncbi:MAG: oligosaccharide flippase family protein [Rhodothermales bacterium]|nr:oligosaccharide flippase family protein [Rhodothermales bacterium]